MQTRINITRITKIMTLMKHKKFKLFLVLSHCFILTPVTLIRTLMTFNIYSKPLIRPMISLLLVNQEFSKTKKNNINLPDYVIEYTGAKFQAGGTKRDRNDWGG